MTKKEKLLERYLKARDPQLKYSYDLLTEEQHRYDHLFVSDFHPDYWRFRFLIGENCKDKEGWEVFEKVDERFDFATIGNNLYEGKRAICFPVVGNRTIREHSFELLNEKGEIATYYESGEYLDNSDGKKMYLIHRYGGGTMLVISEREVGLNPSKEVIWKAFKDVFEKLSKNEVGYHEWKKFKRIRRGWGKQVGNIPMEMFRELVFA